MNLNDKGVLSFLNISECGITDGLVGWWPLNSNANDFTEYKNHGTVNGATLVPAFDGKMGYSFDGTDDYVSLPNNIVTTQHMSDNGISYSTWVKGNALGIEQRIIGQQISSGYSDYSSGGLGISSSNHFKMIAYSSANPGAYQSAVSETTLNTNDWFHVVGTYNAVDKYLRVYVNGQQEGVPQIIGEFRLYSNDANRMGAKLHSSTPYHFNGIITDARVYNRTLSPEEVSILYNATKPNPSKMQQSANGIYIPGEFIEV